MASNRVNLQDFWVGLTKFVLGVAIALFVISLAGVATARYFLTQLATAPERPVYDNDTPDPPAPAEAEAAAAPVPTPAQPEPQASAPESGAQILYQVVVTYGEGLLVRSGPGAEYGTIGGIDYDDTIDVMEESGRWLKVRAGGVEGWVRGQGNTQRL
ncbi:MAG: SH3 domain-containing protein [Cyanobacteria bacterium P01_A01_bin.15]